MSDSGLVAMSAAVARACDASRRRWPPMSSVYARTRTSPRTRPRMVTSGTVVHRCHWEARKRPKYVSVATVVRGPSSIAVRDGVAEPAAPSAPLTVKYRSGSIQSAGGANSTRWTVMPAAAFAVVSGVKSALSLELLTAPG